MKRFLLTFAIASLAIPQAAWAGWNEAKSRHFVIYSEQSPQRLKAFAEELERFDQTVRRLRGLGDPPLTDSGRLTIYVLPSQRAVENLIGRPNVAGAYIGRAAGAVAIVHGDTSDRRPHALTARGVLFHEYLHHLMLSELDVALPSWMVEGSAEFFSTARIEKDGSVQVGLPPQHRAFGLFNLTGLSTEQMVGAAPGRYSDAQRELLYGRGWLLTHYLTFEPSRKGQLTAYVDGLTAGKTALDSARAAFGDLKQLDRDLRRYLEQRRLTGVLVAANALSVGPVALRSLSAAENAIMPVRIRSDRGVNGRTAPEVAAMARKAAAAFPNDPVVQSGLAEAEYDARNYGAALAAAERALAANPNHGHALIYKARAMMEAGKADPAKADWKTIRAVIGRANRLDPDDAEPLMLFYQTFLAEGVQPNANALDGLIYAQRLAPQDFGLRLLTVRALLSASKLPQAKQVFAPIVNDPHKSRWSAQWAAVQDAMSRGDATAAMTLLGAQDRQYQARAGQDQN